MRKKSLLTLAAAAAALVIGGGAYAVFNSEAKILRTSSGKVYETIRVDGGGIETRSSNYGRCGNFDAVGTTECDDRGNWGERAHEAAIINSGG